MPFDKYLASASNDWRHLVNLTNCGKARQSSRPAGHGDKTHLARAAMAML
ncbi:MAG TPA: hypothetical protein VK937_08155 [Candidatus Limnocylindria bacterium]|nr:hypothetical protein [Candidatus Limnocylindria bacterium]